MENGNLVSLTVKVERLIVLEAAEVLLSLPIVEGEESKAFAYASLAFW
jgi:hypothetical protein